MTEFYDDMDRKIDLIMKQGEKNIKYIRELEMHRRSKIRACAENLEVWAWKYRVDHVPCFPKITYLDSERIRELDRNPDHNFQTQKK